MERPDVQPVDVSIRTNFEALVDLYTEAFHRHPLALELGLVEERSLRVLMRSLMELYSFGFEDTLVYGVVVDGSVVCASVSMSSESHAKIGAMLRFLLGKAQELGFEGLSLSTVKGLPAYRLYIKEGFKVDREAPMGKLTVCHMSKPVG